MTSSLSGSGYCGRGCSPARRPARRKGNHRVLGARRCQLADVRHRQPGNADGIRRSPVPSRAKTSRFFTDALTLDMKGSYRYDQLENHPNPPFPPDVAACTAPRAPTWT